MSKNQRHEVGQKKKKNKCLSCCLTTLIICVVVLGGAFGAGWYFGDQYLRQNVGISMSDAFGLIGKVYSLDESKVVTNAPVAGDETKFYGELKKGLLLKDSVKLDTDELLKLVPGQTPPKATYGAITLRYEGGESKPILNAETPTPTPPAENNALMDMLKGLMTRENLDLAKLSTYTTATHGDFVMQINDRYLCALLNDFLQKGLLQQIVTTPDIGGIPMATITANTNIRQVNIEKKTLPVAGVDKEVTTATLSIGFNIKQIAKPLIKKFLPSGLSFLSGVIDMMLPKKLMATATVGVSDDIGMDILINNMTKTDINNIFKVVATFGGGDMEKLITDMVTTTVMPMIKSINGYVDLTAVQNHNLQMDAFDMVLDFAKINEGKPVEQQVGSQDILATLKGVLIADSTTIIHNPVSDKATADTAIKTQLQEKYLLNFDGATPAPEDDISLDDIFALFGLGKPDPNKPVELMDIVNTSGLKTLAQKTEAEIKFSLSDKDLGAIANGLILGMLPAGGAGGLDLTAMDIKISELTFITKETKTCARTVMSLLPAGMFPSGGGDVMIDLITSLLPARLYITLEVDLDKVAPLPSTLMFNNCSVAETLGIFDLTKKFGLGDFTIESILTQIETPLRDAFGGIESAIGASIVGSTAENVSGKMEMPSLFKIVSTMVLNDASLDAPLKMTLNRLFEADNSDYKTALIGDNGLAPNEDAFLTSLQKSYYFTTKPTVASLFDGSLLTNFSLDAINIKGGANSLVYDSSPISKPQLTDNELGYIMTTQLGASIANMTVAGLNVAIDSATPGAQPRFTFYIEMDIASLIGSNTEIAKFIPINKLYITATCDFGALLDYDVATPNVKYAKTTFAINSMTPAERVEFESLLTAMNGGTPMFDFAKQEKDIGKTLYEQIGKLVDIKGGVQWVNGALELPGVYTFIKAGLLPNSTATEEQIRASIQGLYARNTNPANTNNYLATDIVYKPITNIAFDANTDLEITLPTPPSQTVSAKIKDERLGKKIAQELTSIGGLNQLSILGKNTLDTAGKKIITDYASSSYKATSDYLIATFEITLAKLGAPAGEATKLLPDKLSITMIMDMTTNANVIKFNNMSKLSQDILCSLAGISGDFGSDITTLQTKIILGSNQAYLDGAMTYEYTYVAP